jgi:transcriptional regulator with XRE-family HTH domain
MEGTAFAPIALPDQVWRDPATLQALRQRDVSAIFHLARKYGISQQRIATNIGLVQGGISQVMTGKRRVETFDLMERIAIGFNMPDHARVAFGLAPRLFVEPSPDTPEDKAPTPARITSKGKPEKNNQRDAAPPPKKNHIPRRRFARARRTAGHTQESLAEFLSLDRTTVARWEQGETEPLPYIRPKLAAALNTTLEDLADLLAEGTDDSEDHMAAPNEQLRTSMFEAKVSIEDVAQAAAVDAKAVYRWLTQGRIPYPRHRKAVADYLGVNEANLWPEAVMRQSARLIQASLGSRATTQNNEPTAAHTKVDDVERRELLQHLAALGIVISPAAHALQAIQTSISRTFESDDSHQISHWEEIAADYGYAYLAVPPEQFITDVAADLVSLRLITREIGQDASVYKDWCRIGSALSGLMAKALSNLGHTREARHWWQTAQTASDRSGDLGSRLWVRSQRLIHGLYEQRPPLLLVRQADATLELAKSHACAGLVEASHGRAQALVLTGQADAAESELRRAEHVLSQLPSSVTSDVDSVHGVGEDRLRYTETWVYAHSGNTVKADAAAARAMQFYPASDYRSPAQIKLLQAFARTTAGDVSEGIRQAQATYEVLPPAHRTTMVTNLAKRVLQPIPQHEQKQPHVAAYRELVSLPASSSHKAIGS